MKELKDISWQVPENVYRSDPALSYSTLARYEREGFNNLSHLFDHISTPSLLFGSLVDCLLTDPSSEFDRRFLVGDFPPIQKNMVQMLDQLHLLYGDTYPSLSSIPNPLIIQLSEQLSYQLNWKPETRPRVLKENGQEYYHLLTLAHGRQVVSSELKSQADAAVRALRESDATRWYFASDNPFDPSIRRYYQLKFRATFDDIDYRCMADLIIVDYKNKIIYPCDLKTSSHTEWDFYQSFIQWHYDIQARLYAAIIQNNIIQDDFFRDFTIQPYTFIVVNKETLTPLTWTFSDTFTPGTLIYGDKCQFVLRDPFTIGRQLNHYLIDKPSVPDRISRSQSNDIISWLNNSNSSNPSNLSNPSNKT